MPTELPPSTTTDMSAIKNMDELYKDWFLDYASYVILERAVPYALDGLKPVQRRILHAMKEMDDGRFNKVANIIGQSMQYHPHGDASIASAIVGLGQKELLIETQGNWGDARTGDAAAAARYIEARLSEFAKDVVFNPKTTPWTLSYDGRKKEPITLPVKFPLLLAQGVEGIAVGLSTSILPHNFVELLDASIKHLKGRKFTLYPDFSTGAAIDVSRYNDGERGGRVRCRATIEERDAKTLIIRDIPYGTTTTSLCDSIVKANEKGKIKIKKITDNTAQDIEIQIDLVPGVSAAMTIEALYAFTNCQVSIAPNACVIVDEKPIFTSVSQLLISSVEQTKNLLGEELKIRLAELMEEWHYTSLEKIFIEEKIYRKIENEETWEGVLAVIEKGLKPFVQQFKRAITKEDIVRLTEIKIKRISKFDVKKVNEKIRDLNKKIRETKAHLNDLVAYTIAYYEDLKKKYAKGRERKTKLIAMASIDTKLVAVATEKLYVNRAEGFVGYGLKKDELVAQCSTLDDVIVFRQDGYMTVVKVAAKTFVGKNILYVDIFKAHDERKVYHLIYFDGEKKEVLAKRFYVGGVTRAKEYPLVREHPKSKVLYLSVNPDGCDEEVEVRLSPHCTARKKNFNFVFSSIDIKGRAASGVRLTKYPVRSIVRVATGASTLADKVLYYDEVAGRLSTQATLTTKSLGACAQGDVVLVAYEDGALIWVAPDYAHSLGVGEKVVHIEKINTKREVVLSVAYRKIAQKGVWVKRFVLWNAKGEVQISAQEGNKFYCVSAAQVLAVCCAPKAVLYVQERKTQNADERVKIDIAKRVACAPIKQDGVEIYDKTFFALSWKDSSVS